MLLQALFIAIGEFKLQLPSGNALFGSNLKIFRAVWPWNLTYELHKSGTSSMLCASFVAIDEFSLKDLNA